MIFRSCAAAAAWNTLMACRGLIMARIKVAAKRLGITVSDESSRRQPRPGHRAYTWDPLGAPIDPHDDYGTDAVTPYDWKPLDGPVDPHDNDFDTGDPDVEEEDVDPVTGDEDDELDPHAGEDTYPVRARARFDDDDDQDDEDDDEEIDHEPDDDEDDEDEVSRRFAELRREVSSPLTGTGTVSAGLKFLAAQPELRAGARPT
jgi:hypothetical protein